MRLKTHAVMVAKAVWHGTHLSARDLGRWVADVMGEPTQLPEEMLGAMLAQQSAGLVKISRAEAIQRMRHGNSE